ncbi:type IV fimbrial biogenesis protein FimT [Acidovorax sp. 100]|uniref:GspH/FimT family pseudopilin n=1 Tax=Acidovorax sp. 100 TaxID=2135635 RepID=UPI000EFA1C3B|nr:type IV fimbrial biogenesis protein FimT [Acidovorax sp. 100]
MHALKSRHTVNNAAAIRPHSWQQGFTAIELMVVVAILAVLAALAGPSFTLLIERWRVRDAAEALTSSLYLARSEAIKRGGGVTVDATGGWNTGWKLTYTQNSTTTDIKVNAAPSRVTIAQNNNKTALYVDRWGMLTENSGGVAVAMSFLLYPEGKSSTDQAAIRLCASMGGRIVQVPHGAACPV